MIRFNFLFPGTVIVFLALLLTAYAFFGLGGIVGIVVIFLLLAAV
jgi:hypothetical protein